MITRETLNEFWRSWNSKIGVIFLAIILAASIYVAVSYPWDFGPRVWNNPSYWADNPKSAPPDWIKYFMKERIPPNIVHDLARPAKVVGTKLIYFAEVDYTYDLSPSFLSIAIKNVTYYSRPPIIQAMVKRPDSSSIDLLLITAAAPRSGEEAPYRRYLKTPNRILLSGEPELIYSLIDFVDRRYGVKLGFDDVSRIGVEKIIFGRYDSAKGDFAVLRGRYKFTITVRTFDKRDSIENIRLVIGGRSYGLLGTDTLGRDLAVGLLFGFPIALIIGIISSVITTSIGSMIGMISGYIGGKTDIAIQRICDIILNIPLFPILIFFTFILGASVPKLFIILATLIAFSWPGLTIIIRPMVMQIREKQFIEAALALGAPRSRIILRHVFPQIAPFIFAQMIFFTPSAILAEAALSFLGLGDPSIPTWGQILEYGFRTGAVYLGYWWWVLPPGLLITFSAMTFVLISLGLEPVVNPRLRKG